MFGSATANVAVAQTGGDTNRDDCGDGRDSGHNWWTTLAMAATTRLIGKTNQWKDDPEEDLFACRNDHSELTIQKRQCLRTGAFQQAEQVRHGECSP